MFTRGIRIRHTWCLLVLFSLGGGGGGGAWVAWSGSTTQQQYQLFYSSSGEGHRRTLLERSWV